MQKLSDTVDRKFIESYDISDYEIMTPTGFEPLISSNKTIPYSRWIVTLHNGMSLECADTHILIDALGNEVFAKDSLGCFIQTSDGVSFIVSLEETNLEENMFDLSVDSVDHVYYTNGILSHNTTVVAGYLLHEAIFNKKFNIAILANKRDQAIEILDRFQTMYEELPWFLQPGVKMWNKGSLSLGNGTKVFTAATSGSSIRGKSVNVVYLDEFAHIEDDVRFYTSTYPVITSGKKTKVIITSTPNGMNLFYKIWTDSENGRNAFARCKVHWSEHPHRDETWKKEQLSNMSEKQFAQEFLTEFLGSSDTLLSPTRLQKLTFVPPISAASDENTNVYGEPQPGKSYVMTVDTSEGVGKDYSVISVIDVTETPYKQVAVYRNNTIPPILLAQVASRMGWAYNEAVIVVESNSCGAQVCDALWYEFEYENMLLSKTKQGDNIVADGGKAIAGVRTTKKTKMQGCSSLKQLIESETLLIYDYATVYEFMTFIKKNNSWQAEQGKTDDIVMSLVMFAWFVTQPYFSEMVDADMRKIMRDNLNMQEEFGMILGMFDDGMDDSPDSVSLFG